MDDRDALTVAGLRYLPQAATITGAVTTVIGYLAAQQAQLVPSPDQVVTATVTDAQIAERLREAGYLTEKGGAGALSSAGRPRNARRAWCYLSARRVLGQAWIRRVVPSACPPAHGRS